MNKTTRAQALGSRRNRDIISPGRCFQKLVDVQNWINILLIRFGRLDGIIHCAGVLRDGLLLHKSKEAVDWY